MKKIRSEFDDFFLINVLADLFDPEGSEDIDFVADKIFEGLDNYGLISNKQIINSSQSKSEGEKSRNVSRDDDSFAA